MKSFFLVWFSVAMAAAQQAQPPRAGVGQVQRKMALREAIGMALANNLEIEIVKADIAAASTAVRAARGFWDLSLRYAPLFETRATPAASVLQGPSGKLTEHLHSQNVSFRQPVARFGTLLQADFENARNSTSNPFVNLNPFISSRLVLGFTQPLLRGREIDLQRGELTIRRKRVELSETDFKLRAIDVVRRTEEAYWSLVAARQDAEVKAETVEWARQQLDRNRRMIDAGTLAPVEIAASEAELQRRLDAWYAALGAITGAENELKQLLSASREEPIWSEEILPTDIRSLEPPETDDLRRLTVEALKARPELNLLTTQREINDVQRQVSADLVKPQVNLFAQYVNTGLAGTVRAGDNPFSSQNVALYERLNRLSAGAGLPPIEQPGFGSLPGFLIGGYGSTLSNLFSGRFQGVQAGLQIDFNIRNQTAEANLAQTAIAERRIKLQRAQLEQAIEAQVRNSVQAMQTANQRIAAAEAGARAASEKLESEIRLFQTGESTNFLVLTRQNELADARVRLLVAQLDRNRAVARLEQATGGTLEAHKVTLK